MKIKFTQEQMKYLHDCVSAAYIARWTIGKDNFILLDNFLLLLDKSNASEQCFLDVLRELDTDSPDYPF